MIIEQSGNMLTADAEALVNTVNTVGVMGKGIALQFKRAFPSNFKAYKRACDQGEVRIGKMHVWDAGAIGDGHRYIINFPTKVHWRAKSRLGDIEEGLEDLVRVVSDLGIRSIAVPPLGCGLGGLDWSDVRPAIAAAFQRVPDVVVMLYPPAGAPAPADQPIRTERPRLTQAKAALVSIMERYLPFAMDVTTVDIQKLMYFMQEAGEPLELSYVKGRYGPYADNLRHLLSSMEGHFIRGMGDQSSQALAVVPFEVLPSAGKLSADELQSFPDTRRRIDRVLDLVDGFESTYGLELLATVHWATTRDEQGLVTRPLNDEPKVESIVRSWNERKGRVFTPRHIAIARDRLQSEGWFGEETSGQLSLLD